MEDGEVKIRELSQVAKEVHQSAMAVEIELARWVDLGQRLWPIIRLWPLAGAGAAELECVAKLAELLKVEAVPMTCANMDSVRRDTLKQLAAWVEESGWLRRMAPDARQPFVEAIRDL